MLPVANWMQTGGASRATSAHCSLSKASRSLLGSAGRPSRGTLSWHHHVLPQWPGTQAASNGEAMPRLSTASDAHAHLPAHWSLCLCRSGLHFALAGVKIFCCCGRPCLSRLPVTLHPVICDTERPHRRPPASLAYSTRPPPARLASPVREAVNASRLCVSRRLCALLLLRCRRCLSPSYRSVAAMGIPCCHTYYTTSRASVQLYELECL